MTCPSPPADPSAAGAGPYQLTLYISGATDLSARAVADARRMCDLHLGSPCDLTVSDVNEDPDGFARSGAIAVPALVRMHPLPVRRVVGDLSEEGRVLQALELPRRAGSSGGAG